jgi:hypothetical protein
MMASRPSRVSGIEKRASSAIIAASAPTSSFSLASM